MELKCVLVLMFVHLVTATPHGYGVKGGAGAAAKAEAAAGAGAFTGVPLAVPSGAGYSGVPLAVPSGAGYSGSFAKSSSSSFAASSASSSASSFSFSGSGTVGAGANGLAGSGANGAGTGCSGNCKSGIRSPDATGAGSSNQAYSGANAAAGAIAVSGAPCSSGDCANAKSTEKCTSGKCEPTPHATANEKCTSSGQCSSSLPDDTDDIKVNIASATSKTAQNAIDDQSVKYNKKPSEYEASPSSPYKPSTYLTTPKEDSPCTSSDCGPVSSPSGGVYDKDKPSSYNVPILGPNYGPSTQNTEPCTSGNCKNDKPVIPHTNLPSGPSRPGSICTSGNCQDYPNNEVNHGSPVVPSSYKPSSLAVGPAIGAATGPKSPSYAQPNVPNSAFAGVAAGANAASNYGVSKPTAASGTQKLPYTGGFGGPAGILKPNDFSTPNQIHVSSYKPTSTGPHAPVPCISGNCASASTQPQLNIPTCSTGNCGSGAPMPTSGKPAQPGPIQPSACYSGNCGVPSQSTSIQYNPPTTGNFGGNLNVPSTKPTPAQGIYNQPSFPSVQHDQIHEPSAGQYRPVGTSPVCSSGNCGTQPHSLGPNNPTGPLKPNTQIPSVGFGGPAGVLKPNDFNKPLTPSFKPPTATDNINGPKPVGPSGPMSCSSGNCAYQPQTPGHSPSSIPQTGNFGGPAGILKPNDYSKPSVSSPQHTPAQGSYNQASFPSVQHDQTNEPSTQYKPVANSPGCSSGNCGSQPPSYNPSGPLKPNQQTSPVGFGGPAGILKPNDFNKPLPPIYKPTTAADGSYNPPGPSSPQHDYINGPKPVGSSGPTSCSSGNCAYQPQTPGYSPSSIPQTGNFGGPAGILKPNDHSKPSVSSPQHTPAQGSYNQASFLSVQHDQTNEPSTQYKPVANPPGCSSGNCGSQPPSYNPSGPLKPNQQTSPVGFGGPAGILKPNDFNKPLPPIYKPTTAAEGNYNPPGLTSPQHDLFNGPDTAQYKPVGPSSPTFCSSGNCGNNPQSGSTAAAQSYPSLCSSGKCGPLAPSTSTAPLGSYNPSNCASGNCGPNTQFPPIPAAPKNPSSQGPNQPVISGSYHSSTFQSPSSSNFGQTNSLSQTSTGAIATGSLKPSCSSGKCGPEQTSSYNGLGHTKPSSSFNSYNPPPCTSGNCGSPSQIPTLPGASAGGAYSPATCTSGNCGSNSLPGHSSPHYSQPGASHIAVGAAASASAVAYTGGFGGPPGLLKPYDGGKLNSAGIAGIGPKSISGAAPFGSAVQSSYGKSISGAVAQAGAVAGATAGAYGGNGNLSGSYGNASPKGGCSGGCGSQGGANFGPDGLDGFGALSAAGASAKSVAGAIGGGGAGSYGQAGSFATSSASAHASAGAATKGGYGKR